VWLIISFKKKPREILDFEAAKFEFGNRKGNMKKVMSGVVALGVMLVPCSAIAAVASAAGDFSHISNPNGVWKYGYRSGSTFTQATTVSKVHSNPDVWFWQGLPGLNFGEPTIGKNEGTNSWVINGTTTYNPGDFAMHPGPNGEKATLRWTSASAGPYQVVATFKGADASTSTDVHIEVGGTEVYSAIVSGNSTTRSYTFYTQAPSGTIIDFMVGPNGNYSFDTTITSVTISPTQCWDVADDFSFTANPNGQWKYGYDASGTGTFTLIDSGTAGKVHSDPDVWFWQGGAGYIGEPTAGKNVGTNAWVIEGTTTYEPGDFALHPGPSGERAVVRWTCPTSGNYHIFASFTAGDPSNTSDAGIKKGATTLMAVGAIPKTYDSNIALTAGDTIDFSVGWGSNVDYLYDTTITSINVCKVQ
jgi:hypothetical protein